jgi:MFS family permease
MVKRAWSGILGVVAAQGCVLTAHRMLVIAVPWLVLTSTGSAAETGLVVMCQAAPYVAAQVLAGPLLDRVRPQRVSAVGDLISAASMVVLAVSGTPPVWLLMTMLAVVGGADGPAVAAKRLLLRQATQDAGQPFVRGTSAATFVERGATTGGPALAGLLITTDGGGRVLWLSAGLIAVAALIAPSIRARLARDDGDSHYWRRLRAGSTFLCHERSLRSLTVMFMVTNLLDQALLTILLPMWALVGGHSATDLGLTFSAFGGAATGAALAASWLAGKLPRRAMYLAGFVATVARFVVLAAAAPLPTVVTVFLIAGLGSGIGNPIVEAVQLELIPETLCGRVQALVAAWAWLGIPVGGVVGAVMLHAGLGLALWWCGGAYLAAILYPGWRVAWNPTGTPNATSDTARPDRGSTYGAPPRCPPRQIPHGTQECDGVPRNQASEVIGGRR